MNTAQEAVNLMWRWSRDGSTGYQNWCLRTCRRAWGLPSDESSAIKEWNSIPTSAKSRKWWLAPAGAPHFWEIGAFGHVAIQSNLKGFVWSTDAPEKDKVGRVPLNWFRKRWGAKYLGWSNEFQNHKLPLKGRLL